MTWKTIIAGVDDSREGAWAGDFAWNLAQNIGARCELVHVDENGEEGAGMGDDYAVVLNVARLAWRGGS